MRSFYRRTVHIVRDGVFAYFRIPVLPTDHSRRNASVYSPFLFRLRRLQKLVLSDMKTWRSSRWLLGVLLFWSLYINYNMEAKRLTLQGFRRGSEVMKPHRSIFR